MRNINFEVYILWSSSLLLLSPLDSIPDMRYLYVILVRIFNPTFQFDITLSYFIRPEIKKKSLLYEKVSLANIIYSYNVN